MNTLLNKIGCKGTNNNPIKTHKNRKNGLMRKTKRKETKF